MGLVVAVLLLALAVVSLIVYGGTPHGGPTTSCGPITAFSHSFTVMADCRYVSVGELVFAGLFFFLALVVGLNARPRG